jgi:hypothetical protein
MVDARLGIDLPPGASGTVVFTGGGKSKVAQFLPDALAGFEVVAVCGRCEQPVDTGQRVEVGDLPLTRSGRWRHSCGGTAHMPDEYEVLDQRTQRSIDAYVVAREQIVLSAVTLAELLRLSQAARAVQAGRPGAEERLERAIAEAPFPIRDLQARWNRADKMQLAAIIISIVALLMPLLKDDGAVTPHQLVDLVEKVVEQSGDRQEAPADDPHHGASDPSSGENPTPVEPQGVGGQRLPDSPDDQGGVQQPSK